MGIIKASILTFCICFCQLTSGFAQTKLYISKNGRDSNSGSLEKPFASISKARNEVRKIKGPVVVYVREGVYYLREPVIFSSEDSRQPTAQVIYKAYPGENVVISSSVPLRLKWEDYSGGIKRAKVTQEIIFDQLFVNGVLQRMARYPNYNSRSKYFGGTSADATGVSRTRRWKNPEGGYVHALHKHEWGDFHYRITGKNEKGELNLEGGDQNNRKMGMHSVHRFVENVFEELDTLNEWYFDKAGRTLYFYPGKDINVSTALIEVPQLKSLFEFRGTEQNPVANITIEGLELTQTLRTFMETREPLLRSDWTTYRGGAVVLEGALSCVIKECYFNSVGGNAIYFSNYNRHNEVSGCHIAYAGASGISFVGSPDAVRSPSFEYNEFIPLTELDRVPGPKSNNFPAQCLVYNNLMHDLGQTEKQTAALQISMSQDITASHNTMYDLPRAGINISEGTWGGHVIEYNDIFNTVLESGDHGSFNSWGRDRFWHPIKPTLDSIVEFHRDLVLLDAVKTVTIRNNRIRCDHGWDIDLDDGSSNYHIYNNLLLNGGLKLREGCYRRVENNIIINNSFHPHVWFRNSGDTFVRNIVSTGYFPILMPDVWGKEIDYNIFLDSMALEKSQISGRDHHSVYSRIEFKDPSHGDYQITEDSESSRIGFKNFAMDSFGVVSPALIALAKKFPFPELLTVPSATAPDEVYDFMGMKIKNLTTMGERSATGMSKETGVLVLEVTSQSQAADYLKPNDVILKYNNRVVQKLADLVEARMSQIGSSCEVIVFRNQKQLSVKITLR